MVVNTGGDLSDIGQSFAQTIQGFEEFDQTGQGESGQSVSSILVADCGSSFTRVSLLERVAAGYCFVAHSLTPTTVEPPWSDASVGVRHAMEQITDTTGRVFFDDSGALLIPEMGGGGVDRAHRAKGGRRWLANWRSS